LRFLKKALGICLGHRKTVGPVSEDKIKAANDRDPAISAGRG
jgi:hypothetical protein